MRSLRNVGLALLAFIGILVAFGVYESYFTASSVIGQPVSEGVYSQLYSLANSNFSYSFVPSSVYVKTVKVYNDTAFANYGGKVLVLYVGAEWCPYCAADRWAILIALMRFGNFTGLEYMLSSSSDVYPDSPTFTFANSTYSSPFVYLLPYEYENRQGQPLDTPPAQVNQLWKELGNQSIPFVYVGGYYYQVGTIVNPGLISGQSWSYVLQQLQGNTQLSKEVYYEANILTAEICKADNNQPSHVCQNPVIQAIEKMLSSQVDYYAVAEEKA